MSKVLDSAAEGGNRLSFYQRHFTRPISKDSEKAGNLQTRRFSFMSWGSLMSAATLLSLLLIVAAVAISLTLEHEHQHRATGPPPFRTAIESNFPDPTLWYQDGVWYAYATNEAAGILDVPDNVTITWTDGVSNIQLATSTDFVTWDLQAPGQSILPQVGAWALSGNLTNHPKIPRAFTWAPGIAQRKSDNKTILYYAAAHTDTLGPEGNPRSFHCIGAAVSNTSSPAGPFSPLSDTIACPTSEGGAIDPAAFRDVDDTLYLTYKIDGNSIGHGGSCGNTVVPRVPTPIKIQKLMDDAVTPIGDPVTILNRTDSDGPLVEAPFLIRSDEGVYFLFFSSGCTRSPSYTVKYATATSLLGPYTRAAEPLLQTGDWGLDAPGSVGIFRESVDAGWKMAFHARVQVSYGGVRAMFTTDLELNGTQVRMVSDKAGVGKA